MTMVNSAISKVDIAETLGRIRALSTQSKASEAASIKDAKPAEFNQLFDIAKHSVAEINNTQLQSEALKSSYLSGDPKVSISQVMVSSMQSKLAFEGLLVVRNKLLDAYKEIMNMPV
jgi:flagellar hook-basal body complex protein FliE